MEDEATGLKRARISKGLSQGEVCARLREARKRRQKMPPKDSSLKRMYTDWEKGRVTPIDWRDELCEVFELPPAALGIPEDAPPAMLRELPSGLEVARLSPEVIEMLETQTDHYRRMDRLVGSAIIPQTTAHVEYMQNLLRSSLPGQHSPLAAVALAEGAALAGWQALDAGDVTRAWNLHHVARSAAAEGDNPAVLAHVTAQQAYALLDAGRHGDAVELVQYANRREATKRVPARLQAWLAAAEAEFLAADGQQYAALKMLDRAAEALPDGDSDPELPYLMLNAAHLARWRGHCLARLGSDEAIDDLTTALEGTRVLHSKRAEAGLRVDLALALRSRGDVEESKRQARQAAELAGSTGSIRQRMRIFRLLTD